MKASIKKVFWKSVTVKKEDKYYVIYLDKHLLKTPAQSLLKLPNRKIANMVANEWLEQEREINYKNMLANNLVNLAIDKVRHEEEEIRNLLKDYAQTDLLYYRSEKPEELIDKQSALWDPFLNWIKERFKVSFKVTHGVMPIDQPKKSLNCLKSQLNKMSIFQLACFHELVTISGSFILSLAAVERITSPGRIWKAAILDENWQSSVWGEDDEQKINLNRKKIAFFKAYEVYHSLS